MSSIYKLAIIALTAIALGALQRAIPALTNQPLAANSEPLKGLNTAHLKNEIANQNQSTQQGALYFQGQKRGEVTLSPLLHTDVDINVTGIVARTRVTQSFKNASGEWVNGEYVFPLPENAAVDHLLMTIGDRKIEGKIKEKQQAQKIYQQAKRQGKKASLITQHRPNMFSNKIANIGPGETIKVSIEYQQTLSYQNQRYRLRFPMTITPRYSPTAETALTVQPSYMPGGVQTDRNIDLQVNLKTGFELEKIESEVHPIHTRKLSDGSLHIQLPQDQIANKDFVLSWQPELGAQPQTSHISQNVDGFEYGLFMVLPPKQKHTETAQNIARNMTFVLDTSGSMQGESITQAKQALLTAINQLSELDTFNLIEFNSYAQNLWHKAKPATQHNKNEAIAFVSALSANGGTNMHKAFTLALNKPTLTTAKEQPAKINQPLKMRQIIFITDGSVSNEEALMQQIERNLGDSRLFTVGIGSAPNSYFMTEAAKMGRGSFTYIGSTHQVKDKMQQLLDKIRYPVFTDLQLKLNQHPVNQNPNYEIYPNVLSDLYYGEPLIISYRRKPQIVETNPPSKDVFTLIGQFKNQPWNLDIELNGKSKQSGLNVLWAREKIAQLTRDKRRAHMTPQTDPKIIEEYKQQITKTALTHHLVSQYTSLIAVELMPSKPKEQIAEDRKVLNRLPAGSKAAANKMLASLPQTATTAELKLLIGLFLIGFSLCIHLYSRKKRNSQY